MRLALRLALTFGLLAAASSILVGIAVRYSLAAGATARFQADVKGVCERIATEVKRQGEADQALITGACQSGELVERVAVAFDTGEIDERRTGFSQIVRGERKAFGVDELLVGADKGDIVGASPTRLLGMTEAEVDALLRGDTTRYSLRGAPVPAIVSRCTKVSGGGRIVGMVAARRLDPMFDRLGKTISVTIVPSWPRSESAELDDAPTTPAPKPSPPAPTAKPPRNGKARPGATAAGGASVDAGHGAHAHGAGSASSTLPAASASSEPRAHALTERATCPIDDGQGSVLTVDVLKSTRELEENLAEVDRAALIAAVIAAVVAFLVAVVLARSVSRPLSVLAAEAGKVAAGEARPLQVKGSGEIRELGAAFDRMIQDLAVTRRRLAAASRVAAWREVARRVAHEVKNPLAPIRAAVETLRRLRAREDPRFDEYFDEATRTVLDEVHRIANIVTEFTRFARLPTPKPQDVDAEEVARHVVQVHAAAAGEVALRHVAGRRAPMIRADRDQVIQVLTNLVQNALDAVKDVSAGAVTITTDTDGHYVAFSVADNGAGIAPEIAARLFEPYATTKATGTGLGLAIAQRIALEHNGELSYIGTSASGKGAVFRLLLPVEGPPPMSETTETPPSDRPLVES